MVEEVGEEEGEEVGEVVALEEVDKEVGEEMVAVGRCIMLLLTAGLSRL